MGNANEKNHTRPLGNLGTNANTVTKNDEKKNTGGTYPEWMKGGYVSFAAQNGERYLCNIISFDGSQIVIRLYTTAGTPDDVRVDIADPRLSKPDFRNTTNQARIDRDKSRRPPNCTCPSGVDFECWCHLKAPQPAPTELYRQPEIPPTPVVPVGTPAPAAAPPGGIPDALSLHADLDARSRPEIVSSDLSTDAVMVTTADKMTVTI